jgi:hypothetical protein
VLEEIRTTIVHDALTRIPGLGGWSKGRVAAPKMNIGKSGGFRVVFLFLKVRGLVYLAAVYFKSEKADLTASEKQALARFAACVKQKD